MRLPFCVVFLHKVGSTSGMCSSGFKQLQLTCPMLNGSNGSPHRGSNSELHEWQSIAFDTEKKRKKKNIIILSSNVVIVKLVILIVSQLRYDPKVIRHTKAEMLKNRTKIILFTQIAIFYFKLLFSTLTNELKFL